MTHRSNHILRYSYIYTCRNSWPHQTPRWSAKQPGAWLVTHYRAIKTPYCSCKQCRGNYNAVLMKVVGKDCKTQHKPGYYRRVCERLKGRKFFLRSHHIQKCFERVSSFSRAAWNLLKTGHVPTFPHFVPIILWRLFHGAILNEAICTIKAQKASAMWSSETWTNPLLSAAGGLTPGQTLQPDDLSSAMETSTNPVAFVSAQKKMPQINLALGIHLLFEA